MVAADRACSSGQVFNNDSLPERGFHAVGQDAAQRVGRAACRKRYNNGNRACGKRLGPREAGGERDTGRAGGQAQNIAAWNCHGIASRAAQSANGKVKTGEIICPPKAVSLPLPCFGMPACSGGSSESMLH